MQQFIALSSFFILSISHVFFIKVNYPIGRSLTKTLLMPALTWFYISAVEQVNVVLLIALLFSFLGDVFLILDSKKTFLAGLIAFLLAHAAYIFIFAKGISIVSFPSYMHITLLFYIIIGIIIYYQLFPYLNNLRGPVIVYISVILTMSFVALLHFIQAAHLGSFLSFLGTVLFLSSDTILAFNQFKKRRTYGDVWVMATYISAQLFIVLGLL